MGRFEVVGFYVECCLRFEAAVARMLEYETNCWEHTTSRALPHPQCDEWLLLCVNLVTLAEPTERILGCILFHISASFVFGLRAFICFRILESSRQDSLMVASL